MGASIRLYSVHDILGELTVILMIVANVAVSKQTAQKIDGERFNFRKLNELEVRKQYQIKISERFAAFENLRYSKDVDRAWENIKENIKISAKESLGLHELKQHKPRRMFTFFRSKEAG